MNGVPTFAKALTITLPACSISRRVTQRGTGVATLVVVSTDDAGMVLSAFSAFDGDPLSFFVCSFLFSTHDGFQRKKQSGSCSATRQVMNEVLPKSKNVHPVSIMDEARRTGVFEDWQFSASKEDITLSGCVSSQSSMYTYVHVYFDKKRVRTKSSKKLASQNAVQTIVVVNNYFLASYVHEASVLI